MKAMGISVIITVFAYFAMESPKPNTVVYLLFVAIFSFISTYLISLSSEKAYQKYVKDTRGQ
ncbi:hypothetical protein D3H55_14365 [Bacillus salacetis]|uniref:Uncharacterized protein n=2 Tax=Bacillus salacetis TaxID=2315464 RepID=A0A3A1R026_9BACI|nr:hypothetical protein D3H55_14365 [Bacillus salacetis]